MKKGQRVTPVAAHHPVPIALLGPAGRSCHVHKALDKSPVQDDARILPRDPAKDRDGA